MLVMLRDFKRLLDYLFEFEEIFMEHCGSIMCVRVFLFIGGHIPDSIYVHDDMTIDYC